MRIRWFGPPWPDENLRAAICEDDAYRIETPNVFCCECGEPIIEGDRGVATAAWREPAEVADKDYIFEIVERNSGSWHPVRGAVAYHVDCFVGLVVPELRTLVARHPAP